MVKFLNNLLKKTSWCCLVKVKSDNESQMTDEQSCVTIKVGNICHHTSIWYQTEHS